MAFQQRSKHEFLMLKCRIPSSTLKKSEKKIRYDDTDDWNQNLLKLLSQIVKKFKFLSDCHDSEWTICLNSHIIDKRDAQKFGTILSSMASSKSNPAVVEIVRPTTLSNEYNNYQSGSKGKFVVVHHNNQQFKYTLDDDSEEWDDDTFEILQKAIANRFNISGSFDIFTKDSQIDIEDIECVKEEFDSVDGDTLHVVLEVEEADDPPIINQNYAQYPPHQPPIDNRFNQSNIDDVKRQHKPPQQMQRAPVINPHYGQYPQHQRGYGYNNNDNQFRRMSGAHNNDNPYIQPQQQVPPQPKPQPKPMDINQWLEKNNLTDVKSIANVMTLDGLLGFDSLNLNVMLGAMGLKSDEVARIIQAVENDPSERKSRRNSKKNQRNKPYREPQIQQPEPYKGKLPDYQKFLIGNLDDLEDEEYESDIIIDEIKDDGKHPVYPLVMPNNCTYDERTGRMRVDHSRSRRKLIAYQPALDFIRSINSKIATVSIVGKARTGKSLIAGELYAPKKLPCPFDLGHKMDACTYGIWVSAKPIKNPYQKDTVMLVLDVEGTGFHQASKHNDMQLMVIALLISSYFIYNSKGAFDAPALDEIKFVLELTKNIHTDPNNKNENGDDFKKFFPIFMWILRDVHLEPVINNKKVSVREYFTKKVLSSENGFSADVLNRQFIRQAFIQMFQKYDAFALPMPHGNKKVLQNLGNIARSRLQPEFNNLLEEFVDKVMRDAKCKTLFSKDENGEDQYTHCTGTHLAGWIEQCLESINSDKIPQISSMTDSVMADVFRVAKKKAVKQYRELLDKGLKKLRNGKDDAPLEENDIIDLHITTWNRVLGSHGKSLQPRKVVSDEKKSDFKDNDDSDDDKEDEVDEKPQIKVYREFRAEIGHSQNVRRIGQQGIMYRKLSENRTLSTAYCQKYLEQHYKHSIEPIMDDPKKYDGKELLLKFTELENKYYKECKGPSKEICWKEFESKTKREAIQQFKRIRGINEQLLKAEAAAKKQKEEQRKFEEVYKKREQELKMQQKAVQEELIRIKKAREAQKIEHEKKLQEAEKRLKDMKDSNFAKLAETFTKTNKELNDKLIKIQEKNKKEMAEMVKKFEKKIEEAAKANPNAGTVVVGGGGYYGPYPYAYGYGYNGLLPYSLIFSKPYSSGFTNTYETLQNDNASQSACAYSGSNSYIEANLGGLRFVTHVEVKGTLVSGWYSSNKNSCPCVVQYRNANNQWITIRDFTSSRMPSTFITTISVSQHAGAVRILSTNNYATCGTLRVYGSGGSPYYPHQPHFVLYDDVMGSSTILQSYENEALFSILPDHLKYRKYKLLFRGSIHGFAASTFHSRCNGQGQTITVVQSTNNHVFGAYTALSWSSKNGYGNDANAFIFLLRSQRGTAVPQKWMIPSGSKSYAIYDNASYGPSFGHGYDIYLSNSCNANNSSYSNFGYAYRSGTTDTNMLAGSYNFKVQDYEVWRIV